MMDATEWKDTADWSGLPDVYVTKAECQQGMFWRIEACSVPMAIGPEVRLIRADRVAKLLAEAEARGMERAAKLVPTGYTFWAKKPHNARWARKIDGTPIPNDLPVCIQEIIHAEAAAIRRAEGAPK